MTGVRLSLCLNEASDDAALTADETHKAIFIVLRRFTSGARIDSTRGSAAHDLSYSRAHSILFVAVSLWQITDWLLSARM